MCTKPHDPFHPTTALTGEKAQTPPPYSSSLVHRPQLLLRKHNVPPAPASRRRGLGAPSTLPLYRALAPSLGHGVQKGGAGRVTGAGAGPARVPHLNEAPCVSQLSVPAHFAHPDAAGTVRAASCDGLLLLDFADTRQFPSAVRKLCHSSLLHEMAAAGEGTGLDVTRFVCNPLSGQLFRLPVPDMDVAKGSTPFGLLTQSSEGSHGPPDRYVVAQLSCPEEGDSRRVVRRYLSETGGWDERQLFVPSTTPAWRAMEIDANHEVLALDDRLWWVDLSWGACSVDPFSDRPEHRFVELPDCSVLPAPHFGGLALAGREARYGRMGVSEGKLRYVQLCNTEKSFQIGSFSLDIESSSWTLDHAIEIGERLPHILGANFLWIAAIDPFKANVLYFQNAGAVIAVDMAKGVEMWRSPLPHKIASQMMRHSSLVVPCVLPTWLASSYIPGTLASNKTSCKRKTLAEMLVRVDKG